MKASLIRLFVCATLLISLTPLVVQAQSTSPWLRLTDESIGALPAGSLENPTVGDAYLTVDFVSARVYQKSNWWTNLVEKNRVGVVDTSLSGLVNGRDVGDTRASKPRELRKNDSLVDFGFAPIVVVRFPTTYPSWSSESI